jgi:hypothetical protein
MDAELLGNVLGPESSADAVCSESWFWLHVETY